MSRDSGRAPRVNGISLVSHCLGGCVYVLAFSLRCLCIGNPFMKGVGRRARSLVGDAFEEK